MSTATPRRRRSHRSLEFVGKPRGLLHPRVQKVGPEHFGLLCVDCAKSRSVWMLADFYGRILGPVLTVAHTRGDLEAALANLRRVMEEHQIADAVAAVERTGAYHLLVKRALIGAGWEVRIVHPYATKQFRQPADPGNKTDQTDLLAIHRAAVAGLGLLEPELDEPYRHLRLLTRHRRDLVQKATVLRCQIQEHLHAVMPGFASLFDDLWATPLPLTVAREVGSAPALLALGEAGLARLLQEHHIPHQQRTLAKLLAWARTAPPGCAPAPGRPPEDSDALLHRHIYGQLEEDHQHKQAWIMDLERQIAALLVNMPYVLLLSVVGINVVSAADLAAEMGPITHYASATHLTGRAGLYPSRYQSDATDHADGPLVRCGNRRLRTALLTIADNLVVCNDYFAAKNRLWRAQGKDARWARVKVAKSFSRIVLAMVAGRQVFAHPCCRQRAYILDKLLTFGREHHTPPEQLLTDLRAALRQVPGPEHGAEARPLHRALAATRHARTKEPQALGEILPLVLAELGRPTPAHTRLGGVKSDVSGSQDPG